MPCIMMRIRESDLLYELEIPLTFDISKGAIEAALPVAIRTSGPGSLEGNISILTVQRHLDTHHVVSALAILQP